jgi:hypothetical protein
MGRVVSNGLTYARIIRGQDGIGRYLRKSGELP